MKLVGSLNAGTLVHHAASLELAEDVLGRLDCPTSAEACRNAAAFLRTLIPAASSADLKVWKAPALADAPVWKRTGRNLPRSIVGDGPSLLVEWACGDFRCWMEGNLSPADPDLNRYPPEA